MSLISLSISYLVSFKFVPIVPRVTTLQKEALLLSKQCCDKKKKKKGKKRKIQSIPMEMHWNSYMLVYPVTTNPTTSLTFPLNQHIHLRETVSVTKRGNNRNKKEKIARNQQIRFYETFCWMKRTNIPAKRETEGHHRVEQTCGRWKRMADSVQRASLWAFAIYEAQRDVDIVNGCSTPFNRHRSWRT